MQAGRSSSLGSLSILVNLNSLYPRSQSSLLDIYIYCFSFVFFFTVIVIFLLDARTLYDIPRKQIKFLHVKITFYCFLLPSPSVLWLLFLLNTE